MKRTERARADLKAAFGPNLTDAAKTLGVAQSYLSMMTRGKRIPSLPMACRISKKFGVSLDTIAEATVEAA